MTSAQSRLRILVLCTGNSCRSQMAEGFFRHFGSGRIEVHSAGTHPQGVNQRAIRAMHEVGIDISSHRSTHVDEFVTKPFDYVITVCDNAAANCPIFSGGGVRLHWPFDDPAHATGTEESIMQEFRRVRDQVATRVRDWLEKEQPTGNS